MLVLEEWIRNTVGWKNLQAASGDAEGSAGASKSATEPTAASTVSPIQAQSPNSRAYQNRTEAQLMAKLLNLIPWTQLLIISSCESYSGNYITHLHG